MVLLHRISSTVTKKKREHKKQQQQQHWNIKLNAKLNGKSMMVGIEDWSAFVWLLITFFARVILHSHSPSVCFFPWFRWIVLLFDFNYFFFLLFLLVGWLVFWTFRDRIHCERFSNGFRLWWWMYTYSQHAIVYMSMYLRVTKIITAIATMQK